MVDLLVELQHSLLKQFLFTYVLLKIFGQIFGFQYLFLQVHFSEPVRLLSPNRIHHVPNAIVESLLFLPTYGEVFDLDSLELLSLVEY